MKYIDGWNAYLQGVPFDRTQEGDWRKGWSDAAAADPDDQVPMCWCTKA